MNPLWVFSYPQHSGIIQCGRFKCHIVFVIFPWCSSLVFPNWLHSRTSIRRPLRRSLSASDHLVWLTVFSFLHYQTIKQAQKVKSHKFEISAITKPSSLSVNRRRIHFYWCTLSSRSLSLPLKISPGRPLAECCWIRIEWCSWWRPFYYGKGMIKVFRYINNKYFSGVVSDRVCSGQRIFSYSLCFQLRMELVVFRTFYRVFQVEKLIFLEIFI